MNKKNSQKHHGFTLIEVMITLAIIGILASIAYPSYAEYIMRGHRADARAQLQQIQLWMERAATANGVYPTASNLSNILPSSLTWANDSSKRYTMGISASTNASFTLTAAPKSSTPQAKDKCGTLTLSNLGVQGITSLPTGSSMSAAECWKR